jgi:hypothetical protein
MAAACTLYEHPPLFYPADSQSFGGLDISEKVPLWMHTASQISIGGRKQVLENGRDVCDSESDSENEDYGEVLTGMYAKEIKVDGQGSPLDSRHKISSSQSNDIRAQASAVKDQKMNASGAGDLRSAVGSGSMDTCVAKGHPS